MAKARVVLDANALMMPFQFRINLDAELLRLVGECEVYVPASVVRELRRLARERRMAKAAAELAARYLTYETRRPGDAAVLEAAEALGAAVVTNDAVLLETLRRRRIPRITLRSRTHLALES